MSRRELRTSDRAPFQFAARNSIHPKRTFNALPWLQALAWVMGILATARMIGWGW